MPLLCLPLFEVVGGDEEDGGKAWLGFGASPGSGWRLSRAGMKKQRRSQRTNYHSLLAHVLDKAYPDDARQRVQARPEGPCRCI